MRPINFIKNFLARHYAGLYPADLFAAVCGTSGKRVCVDACAAVLSQKYKTIFAKADSDLLKLTPAISKVILEMGPDVNGIRAQTLVFTTFEDTDGFSEKGLIESLEKEGVAILNWEDPATRKLADFCKGKVFFYGRSPQNCIVWAGNIKIENYGTSFELNLGVERVKVNLKLLGEPQVLAALAAAVLGVISDIPLTKIKLALETLTSEEHKMQAMAGPNGSVIIDNTYGLSYYEAESAIDTLLEVPARRRIVVLGEMKDLGSRSEKLHRQMAQKIYKEKLDLVFLGQGETHYVASELSDLGFWEERMWSDLTSSQLVSKLLKTLGKGDVCLIHSHRSQRLDEVVKRTAKKI